MSLKSFPLAWRWMSESHRHFPPEILQGLHPLEPATAKALLSTVPKTLGPDAETHQATDPEATQTWLRHLPVTASEVTLLWNNETALILPWSTFVSYWDDFCYPSSDDAAIIPGSRQGMLLWHHYEVFEYKADAL